MEKIRLYNLMNVNTSTLIKNENQDECILKTEKRVFNTLYISHIPITLNNEDFEKLKSEKKTYKGAKETPIIHEIRKQAIKYLKDTNSFNK